MDMKRCPRCTETLSIDKFTKSKGGKNGVGAYCRPCSVSKAQEWQIANRARFLQKKAENFRKHQEALGKTPRVRLTPEEKLERRKTKEQRRRAQAAIWRANNKENAQARSRKLILKNRGLTQEDFAKLLASQNGACAICGLSNIDARPLCVDHDHSCRHPDKRSCSNCNRGLLCVHCNTTLHKMENMHGWHLKALAYLERYKER